MSSGWNFGGGGRVDQSSLLDLKALLNQVTGGSLGGPTRTLGPLNSPQQQSSNNTRMNNYSNHSSSGGGNPAGVIGGGVSNSSASLGLDSNSGNFFDPFSSMSTFGFFNAANSTNNSNCNNSSSASIKVGGGDNNMGNMMMGGGGRNKSPVYGGGHQQSSSPIFGGSNSPINFFGGGGGGGGSNNYSNNYASNSNNKFPISTFSIDDTLSSSSSGDRNHRDRDRDNRGDSCSGGGYNSGSTNNDDSNNGHFAISHFGSSNNYRSGGGSGDRDNFGSSGGERSSSNHHNNRTNEHGENSFNQGVRETGIIEKLLHSYGFIQCCERQARLFFHFSQFDGTIEHLKLGDPVEFEMTYDRRTGKPIASAVTKIGPEVVLSEERVTGTVTTELHHESNGELQGRISYENRGECFFLPYCQEDIEGNVTLSVGDTVSFQIATNQRSGNLTARYCRLENPARPVRYRGIVSSLKDNFGFIERADVAKEIFFHFAETRITDSITINDNVEFNIQTRTESSGSVLGIQGKEVAVQITKLPFGTVVFEDIGSEMLKGQILKPIDKTLCPSPALGPTPRSESSEGRLRYRGPDRQELEVVFGEKDQKGTFTMRHGDWVQFNLAIDRRNKQQRATNVTLLEESFSVSGERREEGVVSAIKGDCGYITCAERDTKMYFRFSELLNYTRQPRIADDVEFTIVQDGTSPIRQAGIRIKYLKHGSVCFEVPVSVGLHGVVVREPSTPWVSQEALVGILPSLSNLGLPQNVTERLIQSLSSAEVLAQLSGNDNQGQGQPGVIQYASSNATTNWTQETIIFHWKDCKYLRNITNGTKVIFDIHQVRRNRDLVAANIRADTSCNSRDDSPDLLQSFVTSNGIRNASPPPAELLNSNDIVTSLLNHHNNDSSYASSAVPPPDKLDIISTHDTNGIMSSTTTTTNNSSLLDFDDCDMMMTRRSSRSPSDSSDKLVINGSSSGSYSGYAPDHSPSPPQSTHKTPRVVMKGYIAALKDGFGFIETMAQDGEIFFHSSSLVGDFAALEVGQEVEYVVSSKGSSSGKNAADIVKPLPKGSIGRAAVFPDILQGIVVRPLRGANPDQTEYTGLIDGQDLVAYPFGIISMLNKKELLQAGEAVEFQLDSQGKPVNIRAIRKKLRAAVEAVKGQYGFLSYELDDGKKLFFHMSEVKDHQHLNPGDEVEFVILQNPRNGKSSACSVLKVGESQRPERLLNRLSKLSVDESAPRLIVVRQPFGPDGTRGFSQSRTVRKAGTLNCNRDSTSSN